MTDEKEMLEEGDKVRVDGEQFVVSHIEPTHAVLIPKNENGHGQLDWSQLDDGCIFSRHKNIRASDVSMLKDVGNEP